MDLESLKKLKVTELKEKLNELGLSHTGKKDELVHRLYEAQQTQASQSSTSTKTPESKQTPKAAKQTVNSTSTPAIGTVSNAKSPTVNANKNEATSKSAGIIEITKTLEMTEEERKKLRMQKFGIQNPDDKLQKRALKFGVASPVSENKKVKRKEENPAVDAVPNKKFALSAEEEEKRKQRALRFGTTN